MRGAGPSPEVAGRIFGLGVGLAFGLGVSGMLLAAGEIYRCTDGELTIFSDQPCDDEATAYAPRRDLSVVEPPESMGSIIESNEQYLEAQRAEREARRQQRIDQERREAGAARYVPPVVRTIPVDPAYTAFPGRPSRPSPAPASDRLEARRGSDGRAHRRATDESRVPLPARTGPSPGRRDDDG